MIVRELIERLQDFDPDTRVLVSGYEDGLDDPEALRHIRAVKYYGGCMGEFDEAGWVFGIERVDGQVPTKDDLRRHNEKMGYEAYEDIDDSFLAVVIPR